MRGMGRAEIGTEKAKRSTAVSAKETRGIDGTSKGNALRRLAVELLRLALIREGDAAKAEQSPDVTKGGTSI